MAGQLPIQFTELAQLNQLGIAPTSIGFNTCTLESDSYVCVRQKVDDNDKPQVIIVNLKNNNEIIKRAISADSAIMHWKQDILALKAQGKTIQVFNLATKSKLKSTTMSEDVVFWKWFSENSLGLVTDTSVYHWNIFDPTQDAPVKMFERSPNLSGNQIINYRVSDDENWMVVVGISQKEGRVAGSMQLYSKARGISQNIEGHAASFATFQAEGQPEPYKLFTFCVRTATSAKLHVVEIDPSSNNARFQKKAVDVYFPQEAVNDFPVAMQVSAKYSIIYMITKYGFIHLYDLETGTCIFMNRISNETIFVTAPDGESSGIVGINRKGQVLSVSLDENNAVPYLLQNPANTELATKLASRAGLAGADDLYRQQFENAFNSGNYQDAAKFAANSPRGFLRTAETINRFKSAQGGQGQMSVILQYFGLLLDKGKLNRYETVELIKPVLAQNRKQLLTKWMGEGKLDYSEELGDIVRVHDLEAALTIYREAGVPSKTVAALAETGRFEEILPYSTQAGYQPDFVQLLQHIVRVNPEKGAEFATQLANTEGGPMVDVGRVVDIFMSQNMVQQATAFLLDALKDNREDQGQLQTRLLEMNLINAPQVADAILGNQMFTHYDKARISQLCEQAGLLQRALENTDDASAIKRIIVQTDKLSPDFLQQYFSRLSVDQSLDAMNEMLTSNIRQNLQAVLQIATKYSELLGPGRLIELFERHRTAEGLYYFLGSIVNLSEDPDVVFKYLEAAVTMQQFTEVERICRENNVYQPEKVKAFLIEAQLSEQLPLIIVCDRFNYVKDLVNYLYKHQQYKSIEVYVQQVNPSRTPAVVGALLALDCDEQVIQNLLRSVDASAVPIDELVQEVESQNRLKILLPFLEAAQQGGTAQTGALANALAKIYIDTNNNPEAYLKENNEYDSLVVGKYCEKRDPNLAFIAYSKGQNDLELLNVTNENSMFRAQARYLLDRADPEVWAFALGGNNEYRRSLVDQVTATAVPESTEPDKVSVAVKAFVDADMPGELIDLLEKIILEPSPFSENGSLQNLLMLTAAKSDKARLMDYIHKLDQFSVEEISALCIEQGLYEEALAIHKKVNNHSEAANVLVDHIVSIDRAQDYAEEVDLPEVWSKVAKAQLDGLRVSDSIESYIKAQDPSNYNEVIETATHAGKDEELVKFLKMARKTQREPAIDTALAFSYARLDQLPELEDFLRSANVAESEAAGDRAYEEGYHQAAKIFFTSISNWAKLATTLVHLSEYQQAVDCARRANSVKVWKQVHEACVAQKEFRLAQICGLNLIVHAEELSDLVKDYERAGYFEELISLLEAGLGLERAHMGMFTELGIALSKYHPDRVMEHLKLFWSRINIPKMIRACEEAHLWPELIFLYCHYDEWDNAALAMMERAADAWEHHSFKDIVVKVANLEIYYRAINHYLQEQPLLLTDLLQALTPRIDVNRVVKIFKTSDNVPMIKPFLLNVQNQNKRTVNDAIHELLIEEEDYKTLRDSVENHDNYDAMNLAQRLEKHELVFFRQIAAQIYRKNKRWDRSIALSKQDKLFKDAIETSAISGKPEVVEELLRYFVDIGSRECYVGMLYACYDLIPMHVVMEISWRHGLNDFTMPFMISYMSQQSATIDQLKKDNDERKAREASQKKDDDNTPILGGRLMLTQGPANAAPSPGPYGQTNGITPQPTGFPRAF